MVAHFLKFSFLTRILVEKEKGINYTLPKEKGLVSYLFFDQKDFFLTWLMEKDINKKSKEKKRKSKHEAKHSKKEIKKTDEPKEEKMNEKEEEKKDESIMNICIFLFSSFSFNILFLQLIYFLLLLFILSSSSSFPR